VCLLCLPLIVEANFRQFLYTKNMEAMKLNYKTRTQDLLKRDQ